MLHFAQEELSRHEPDTQLLVKVRVLDRNNVGCWRSPLGRCIVTEVPDTQLLVKVRVFDRHVKLVQLLSIISARRAAIKRGQQACAAHSCQGASQHSALDNVQRVHLHLCYLMGIWALSLLVITRERCAAVEGAQGARAAHTAARQVKTKAAGDALDDPLDT